MRIAALADLHLGFRAFAAIADGRNVREADVEVAWAHAVEAVIAARVDLVTIAGDIFHHPRVSDHAKKAFLDGMRRLLDAGIRVVILQGNHDAGKTADVLTPIMLAEGMGDWLHVVTTPKRIRFTFPGDRAANSGICSVACYPFVSRGDGASYRLDPDPTAEVNVLVMHAAVKGAANGDQLPFFYGSGESALDIGREADRWDVIAVGDYHEFTRLHPERLAFYSGSIERTSTNIWQEHEPKGWVLVDTEAGTMELQEIPTRRMADYDLGDFDMPPGVGATDVNNCMSHLTHAPEGSIVRFKVDGFPRGERDQIDWSLVREIKHRCAHFELDLRFAKKNAVTGSTATTVQHRAGVKEQATAFFAEDDQPLRDLIATYLEVTIDEVPDYEIIEPEEAVA